MTGLKLFLIKFPMKIISFKILDDGGDENLMTTISKNKNVTHPQSRAGWCDRNNNSYNITRHLSPQFQIHVAL